MNPTPTPAPIKGRVALLPLWGRSKAFGWASVLLGLVEWHDTQRRPCKVAELGRWLAVPQPRALRWLACLVSAGVLARVGGEGAYVGLGPSYGAARSRLLAEGLRPVPVPTALPGACTLATRLVAGTARAETFARRFRRPRFIRTDAKRAGSVGLARRTVIRACRALLLAGVLVQAHVVRRTMFGWCCLRAVRMDYGRTIPGPRPALGGCSDCHSRHGPSGRYLKGTAVPGGPAMSKPPPSDDPDALVDPAKLRGLFAKLGAKLSAGGALSPRAEPSTEGPRALENLVAPMLDRGEPAVRVIWSTLTAAHVHPGQFTARRSALAVELARIVPARRVLELAREAFAKAQNVGAYLATLLRAEMRRYLPRA